MDELLETTLKELKGGIEFAYHRCHCGLAVTMGNALSLLKAQEPVKPKLDKYTNYTCGACGRMITRAYKFCPECGKKVKWE